MGSLAVKISINRHWCSPQHGWARARHLLRAHAGAAPRIEPANSSASFPELTTGERDAGIN